MDYNIEIKLDSISKAIGSFSLGNISLKAEQSEIIGIIGENGAGKTTLLRIIGGLLKKDTGTLLTPSKRDIGFVFDSNHLPGELNANQINTVMSYIFINWDKGIFRDYIDKFKLPLEKKIKNCSKGMKTKLNIAVALSHKPKVLLLDEITSGLDPLIKNEILETIRNYVDKNNCISIMTTHILDDVVKIADKVLVLDNGRVILNKDVVDFKDTHALETILEEIITRG